MFIRFIVLLFTLCQISAQEAFMERLKKVAEETAAKTKQASQETKERVEKASQETTLRLEQDIAEISKKIEEQTGITASKIHLTVENLSKAFAGYPLLPIPSDEYYKAVFVSKKLGYWHNHIPSLVAITPWNKELIWMDAAKSHVLMVSWMSKWAADKYYLPFLGKTFITPKFPNTYCWVTAVPEIKRFAQNYLKNPLSGVSLQQRLEQFLGLPPGKDERYFVQMWVRPQDLFRPCNTPEIMGSSCLPDPNRAELPLAFQQIYQEYDGECEASLACKEHKQWLNALKKQQYAGALPFPWTRLGFTFDWSNSHLKVGATEFVIKQGSPVIIYSITPTDQYPMQP